MKKRVLKIFVFFFLFAVSAETLTGFWPGIMVSAVCVDNEKCETSEESEPEKKEPSDKELSQLSAFKIAACNLSLFELLSINFKNSPGLSLPYIPPDLS